MDKVALDGPNDAVRGLDIEGSTYDVDDRVVVAVMVPATDRAWLGDGGPGPHVVKDDGLRTGNPRRLLARHALGDSHLADRRIGHAQIVATRPRNGTSSATTRTFKVGPISFRSGPACPAYRHPMTFTCRSRSCVP